MDSNYNVLFEPLLLFPALFLFLFRDPKLSMPILMLLQCDGKKSDDKNGFPEAPGSGTLQYFQLLFNASQDKIDSI